MSVEIRLGSIFTAINEKYAPARSDLKELRWTMMTQWNTYNLTSQEMTRLLSLEDSSRGSQHDVKKQHPFYLVRRRGFL